MYPKSLFYQKVTVTSETKKSAKPEWQFLDCNTKMEMLVSKHCISSTARSADSIEKLAKAQPSGVGWELRGGSKKIGYVWLRFRFER